MDPNQDGWEVVHHFARLLVTAQAFFPEVGPPPTAPENNQHWGTPRVFLDAVERRFGKIGLDLAANETNHVVPAYFGPDSPFEVEDTLSPLCGWDEWIDPRDLRWLNPEFSSIYGPRIAPGVDLWRWKP